MGDERIDETTSTDEPRDTLRDATDGRLDLPRPGEDDLAARVEADGVLDLDRQVDLKGTPADMPASW